MKLHTQIFCALVLAIICGLLVRSSGFGGAEIVPIAQFLGTLFLNGLKMVVVPLVVSSVIASLASLGHTAEGSARVGRLARRTFTYYVCSGFLAICVGLFLVNLIGPGRVSTETAAALLGDAGAQAQGAHILGKVEGRGAEDMFAIFLRMLPPNIAQAATQNSQLLGLIVFSVLYGLFLGRIPENLAKVQQSFFEGMQAVMVAITEFILRFTPIGVFGLVMPVVAKTGLGMVAPLLWFTLTVVLALSLHAFGVLSFLVWKFGRQNPLAHIKNMAPVLLTAFSTASSASTLPVTMRTVQERSGVSKSASSFTLPLGVTVNMDGTALYECVVVIFIAQVYASLTGIPFGLADQFFVVILALVTSVGVAGIPAASLVAITLILTTLGLPVEAVGIVWVVDRVLDMCRTAVNVYSDTCAAIIADRNA